MPVFEGLRRWYHAAGSELLMQPKAGRSALASDVEPGADCRHRVSSRAALYLRRRSVCSVTGEDPAPNNTGKYRPAPQGRGYGIISG